MINLTSPTRTSYSIALELGTTTAGTLSFATKRMVISPFNGSESSMSVAPQNGVSVSLGVVSKSGDSYALEQSTKVDGDIESFPKEST